MGNRKSRESDKPRSTDSPPSSNHRSYTPVNDAYLLLKVPDFGDTTFVNPTAAPVVPTPPGEDPPPPQIDPSGVDNKKLQSFLRLGAFDYSVEPPAAKELLKMIPHGNPASDPGGADPETEIIPGTTKGIVFVDDVRKRPQDVGLTTADDHGHGLTQAERQLESALLYSRGGWRDHSDGNRISTTWGDKVEVVRGNFKMIVMGRQNDPGLAMGWEASGAHIQDYAPGTMPGASYWLEWIDEPRYQATQDGGDGRKGVWLLVNTTENVYEYARNAGNFREEVWGDVNESYVGSENPSGTAFATDHSTGTAGHEPPVRLPDRHYDFPHTAADRATPPWDLDNKGMIRSNPHIVEKTWADRIDSWTGSSGKRIPIISEQTWAEETEDLTNVLRTVTSTTIVGGAVTETTLVGGAQTGTTTVGAAATDTTVVGGANTATSIVAGLNTAIDIAIGGFELGITGGKLGISVTGIDLGLELFIGKVEAVLGAGRFSFELGTSYEIQLGKHEEYGSDKEEKKLTDKITALTQTVSAVSWSVTCASASISASTVTVTAASIKLG